MSMPLTQRKAHRAGWVFPRLLFAVVVTVMAAGARLAIAQTAPPPPAPALQAILPQDTALAANIQSDWLWSATTSLRDIPSVAAAIAQAEKATGLSFENDVVPWVGQVAVAGIRPGATDQQVIIYAQIRDTTKFMATVSALQANAVSNPDVTASTRDYKGDTICDMQPKKTDTKVPQISYAFVNGWALAGIGAGAIEHALDVYNGRSASLQTDPTWSQVFTRLPGQPTAWFAYNTAAILKAANAKAPMPTGMAQPQIIQGVAFTDQGNGFRMDYAAIPQSADLKAVYTSAAQNLHPLTGEIGRRVPDGVLVIELNNPAFLWHAAKQYIRQVAGTTAAANQTLQQLSVVDTILQYFHKDVGVVITWRKERGYGLDVLGQADTHAAAVHTGAVIAALLKQSGAPIVRGGNSWTIAVPGTLPLPVPLKLKPFLSAKDDWLVIGSHPMWTADEGAPTLAPPAAAANSSSLFLLSLQWLPSMMTLVQALGGTQDSDAGQAFALVNALHLENSIWSSWTSCQSDGSIVGGGQVTNWDWRTAITNAATAISNWKTTPKATAPSVSDSGRRTPRGGA
jgi:hypothetical protein